MRHWFKIRKWKLHGYFIEHVMAAFRFNMLNDIILSDIIKIFMRRLCAFYILLLFGCWLEVFRNRIAILLENCMWFWLLAWTIVRGVWPLFTKAHRLLSVHPCIRLCKSLTSLEWKQFSNINLLSELLVRYIGSPHCRSLLLDIHWVDEIPYDIVTFK